MIRPVDTVQPRDGVPEPVFNKTQRFQQREQLADAPIDADDGPVLDASAWDVNGITADGADAAAGVEVGDTVVKGGLLSATLSSRLWRSAFVFELPSQLRSKSNFRRGGDWRPLTGFSNSVATTALMFRPAGWVLGDASRPVAERPPVVAVVAARTLLDSSNLSKSVLDAVEGVLYHTDASVRGETSVAYRSGKAQRGYAAFALLHDAASVAEVAAALADLVGPVVDFADLSRPAPRS